MFDVISLDWGDTLATNHGNPYREIHRRAFARLARRLRDMGVAVAADWDQQLLADYMAKWHQTTDPQLNPEMIEMQADGMIQERVAALLPARDSTESDLAAAAQALVLDEIAQCSETVMPYPRIEATLIALQQQGYRLAICSLVPWSLAVVQAWFQRRGWDQYISHYSLSSEVGFFKPAPQHYQDLIDGCGVAPERILHVGDHPLRDVIGPCKHGIHTCLRWTEGVYDPAEQERAVKEYARAAICHIEELPGLLAGWQAS